MKIDIDISDTSIASAITALLTIQGNLSYGIQQTVDILVKEGAMIAQASFGSMVSVTEDMPNPTTGIITASGDATIIAEFGAGDATIEDPTRFENSPGVDVYKGSYSEQVGTGEYFTTGKWHFGGRVYTEVPPRAGLYNAKTHIAKNAVPYAKGVIKL